MHRRGIRALAVVLVTMVLPACTVIDGGSTQGSGNVVTETRDVSGFDQVAVFGSGEVTIAVTGTESLMIEAEDNILPLLETEVRNGRLELSVESNISPTSDVRYTITVISLVGVSVSGSGDVAATGVDSEAFVVQISGSGDVAPVGTTDTLSVDIAGSGRYGGEGLVAAKAVVEVSGSGDVVVNATETLDVAVAGSGNVEYLGDPNLTQSISGSGNIDRR